MGNPQFTTDPVYQNAAGTVKAYGPFIEISEFYNFSATAISAGDAVMEDTATSLPTTGTNPSTHRGNCVLQTAEAADTAVFKGIALDPIPAYNSTTGAPGVGRVVRRCYVYGDVGANVDVSLAVKTKLQCVATAGRLGAHTLDTANDVGAMIVATGGAENNGHVVIF